MADQTIVKLLAYIFFRNRKWQNILNIVNNIGMFKLISIAFWTTRQRCYMIYCRRAVLIKTYGGIHGSVSHRFCFRAGLWVNRKWEEEARGGLIALMYGLNIVCVERSGVRISALSWWLARAGRCPRVELSIVWMYQVVTNTHTLVHRG